MHVPMFGSARILTEGRGHRAHVYLFNIQGRWERAPNLFWSSYVYSFFLCSLLQYAGFCHFQTHGLFLWLWDGSSVVCSLLDAEICPVCFVLACLCGIYCLIWRICCVRFISGCAVWVLCASCCFATVAAVMIGVYLMGLFFIEDPLCLQCFRCVFCLFF